MQLAREQIKHGADVIKSWRPEAQRPPEKTTSCQLTERVRRRSASPRCRQAHHACPRHARHQELIRRHRLHRARRLFRRRNDRAHAQARRCPVAHSLGLFAYHRRRQDRADFTRTWWKRPRRSSATPELPQLPEGGRAHHAGTDAGSKYHPLGDVATNWNCGSAGMSNKAVLEAATSRLGTRVPLRRPRARWRRASCRHRHPRRQCDQDIGAVGTRRALRNGVTVFDATVEKSPGLVADRSTGRA